MNNDMQLNIRIKKMFEHDSNSMSHKEWDTLEDQSNSLVDEYGWDAVRQAFFHYVQTECKTIEDVTKAIDLFEGFDWQSKTIPDPYEFLGYLYYRVGFENAPYKAACALDDLCISILPASGYPEANIYYHPYYAAEADPKMIAAVERWRQREANEDDCDTRTDTASPSREPQPHTNPDHKERQ
ncbi:hypothetical protein Uis1B_0528 [Bifidobacterium margollesii]|uniref:Uncharacterized protein n=1 Tax=Bifidobacterium margollesii TaxID=2020964 RepID=A0A2N5JBE7_9BIFI|nr:hypothetical protein [Bifidobacterium margollesii]PLS31537.1 hypothetical protein Uis1B_0528 [Bifidobacterium margollesii]